MRNVVILVLTYAAFLSSPAGAEQGESAQTEERWLAELRGSGTYHKGITSVREYVDAAYDEGAIAGASHWEDIHEYYIGLARMKGCQKGQPFTEGPIHACHQVSGPAPRLTGSTYAKAKKLALKRADKSSYPERVRPVLEILFEYGYVQGLKHGLRVHNEEIRFRQSYYRSCMTRGNSARAEPVCAKSSKAWADALLQKLEKQMEAHGLPARSR
jgi:hypothetical protein